VFVVRRVAEEAAFGCKEGGRVNMEARYFRVRKWEDFQHYKQRNPPWIRLHRTLLRDHKFNKLSEAEQWMLVRIWLLASETDNHMAYDERWVRRAINSARKVPVDKFVQMGFLEEYDGDWSSRRSEEGRNNSGTSPQQVRNFSGVAPKMSADPDETVLLNHAV
jgi:hypothetical protein